MNLPDPSELSTCEWQQSEIIRKLSQLIADAAVEDPTSIPQPLIAAYHDALQLHNALKRIAKESTDARLIELQS